MSSMEPRGYSRHHSPSRQRRRLGVDLRSSEERIADPLQRLAGTMLFGDISNVRLESCTEGVTLVPCIYSPADLGFRRKSVL